VNTLSRNRHFCRPGKKAVVTDRQYRFNRPFVLDEREVEN